MEHDGIHRPGVHEQDRDLAGMDDSVPDGPVQSGVDAVYSSTNNPSPSRPRSESRS
ncbi:hypothetical protein QFZ33_003749 [Arthrobacter globiformis]|nr:hypothetical protein [Arthrobacter globiformis]